MLGFTFPLALLGLPLALLVGRWWLRRPRPALRYSSIGLVSGLPQSRAVRVRWGSAILRALIVAGLVLAVADPRLPDLKTRLPVDGISIVLVLDVSNSMSTADFGTPGGTPISRLDAAKSAFKLFVAGGTSPDGMRFEGRPNDQIGLVTFAAVTRTTCPLTLNHSVLLTVLDDQAVLTGVDAGTNIGDAIAEGLIRLEGVGNNRKKVMILLSDGEHNALGGEKLLPLPAAQLAAHFQVPVYTIDCGGDPDPTAKPEEQKQREDGRAAMAAVATLTKGQSFAANSASELQAVCRSIDELERTPTESARYRRYQHLGLWCGITAVAMLLILVLLEKTIWRRIPDKS